MHRVIVVLEFIEREASLVRDSLASHPACNWGSKFYIEGTCSGWFGYDLWDLRFSVLLFVWLYPVEDTWKVQNLRRKWRAFDFSTINLTDQGLSLIFTHMKIFIATNHLYWSLCLHPQISWRISTMINLKDPYLLILLSFWSVCISSFDVYFWNVNLASTDTPSTIKLVAFLLLAILRLFPLDSPSARPPLSICVF